MNICCPVCKTKKIYPIGQKSYAFYFLCENEHTFKYLTGSQYLNEFKEELEEAEEKIKDLTDPSEIVESTAKLKEYKEYYENIKKTIKSNNMYAIKVDM